MRYKASMIMYGEIGGRYSYHCTEDDISYFVERCAEAGIQRIGHSYYYAPMPEYPWFVTYQGRLLQLDPFSYGETSPLSILVRRAHDLGLQVVSFINAGTGGQWIPVPHLRSGEVYPYIRLFGAGVEQEKYWTKTCDGKTWLDIGPRDPLGAYGYLGFCYPEVREREQEVCLMLAEHGVDGIQLEFMIAGPPAYATPTRVECCDEEGYWAYGYDEPAMEGFKRVHGVDPRTLRNSDDTWVRFRAGYATQHMRELRTKLQRMGAEVELSVFAFSGVFRSPEAGLKVGVDWETWVDEGLVDAIYSRIPGDRPPLPFRERFTQKRVEGMHDELVRLKKAVGDRATVWPVVEMPIHPYNAQGQATPSEAVEMVERAGKALVDAGADRMGFWWFDTAEALDIWPAVREIGSALKANA
jgi:hypothetical protein